MMIRMLIFFRCADWIIKSGNTTTFEGFNENQINNKRICSDHFKKQDFNGRSKRLKIEAIPIEYTSDDDSVNFDDINQSTVNNLSKPVTRSTISWVNDVIPQLLDANYSKPSNVVALSCDQDNDTNRRDNSSALDDRNKDEQIEELRKQLKAAEAAKIKSDLRFQRMTVNYHTKLALKTRSHNKKITILQTKNNKLHSSVKNKNKQLKRLNNFKSGAKDIVIYKKNIDKMAEPVQKFFSMQINHLKKKKWEDHEKQFAFSLYYKSPKAYNFLRDGNQFKLPSVGQIRLWVNEIDLFPGKTEKLLKLLKLRSASMSEKERECVLIFDEMSIKKWLEYNSKKDVVEGFVDLGDKGRSDKVCNHVLTFMLRGRQSKWRQPISYFFAENSVKGDDLAPLLLTILDFVEEAGFVTKSMTCDLGSPNERAIKLLGITKEKPYIERYGRKIFFNFDPPHLLKAIRNNMLFFDLEADKETVSFDVVRELYQRESKYPSRAAPKLTEKHIKPNRFECMNVKLAAQVISKSVSSAILAHTVAQEDPLKNVHAVSTANFLAKVNDLFDCLNSRSPQDPNPMRKPLSELTPQVKNYLKSMLPYIKTWRKKNKFGKYVKNPPCFNGFYLTVNSVLMQYDDMKDSGGKYLLTSHLNQDPVENLFAVLRGRGGHCTNPTARQVRQNLQYNVTANLKALSSSTNCEPDETVSLLCASADELVSGELYSLLSASVEAQQQSESFSSNVESTLPSTSPFEHDELIDNSDNESICSELDINSLEGDEFNETLNSLTVVEGDQVSHEEIHDDGAEYLLTERSATLPLLNDPDIDQEMSYEDSDFTLSEHASTILLHEKDFDPNSPQDESGILQTLSTMENLAGKMSSLSKNLQGSSSPVQANMKYVAGFIASKFMKKNDCSVCKNYAVSDKSEFDNPADLLIFFKAYKVFHSVNSFGNLCVPSDIFFNVIQTAYEVFDKMFPVVCYVYNVKKILIALITDQIGKDHRDFFNVAESCVAHRKYFIDYFVKVHVYYKLKWVNDRLHAAVFKQNRKLQILSHK